MKITRLARGEFKRGSRPHRIGDATDSRPFFWGNAGGEDCGE